MKDAKVEAETIVANYRATMEAEYQTKLAKVFLKFDNQYCYKNLITCFISDHRYKRCCWKRITIVNFW
jgi:hypothetical protein